MIIILGPFHHYVLAGNQQTRVTILAVGHGSANLIALKGGRVVLIDGGTRSAPGFDCGERIIAPYLWHSKIRKIDDIIITHEDADHYNGILTVMKRFHPERLWLPPLDDEKNGFSELIKFARSKNIKIENPKPGAIIEEEGNQISVLGEELSDGLKNEDDRGLVLKLSSGNISVLFPGDITKKREARLVRTKADLKSTILLSPHHGSATSNSFALLTEVSPEIMVFSSGRSGNMKFPAKETLTTADKLGISTLNTSEVGTIIIEISDNGSEYQLITANESKTRYWQNG